jgi:hypothetical protein
VDPAQELVHPGPHRIDPPLGYRSGSGCRLPHLGAEPIALVVDLLRGGRCRPGHDEILLNGSFGHAVRAGVATTGVYPDPVVARAGGGEFRERVGPVLAIRAAGRRYPAGRLT